MSNHHCAWSSVWPAYLIHTIPSTAILLRNPLQANSTLLGSATQAKKRKAFFSFHYADIMRVNNVRKSWEFVTKDSTGSLGFYDQSLWESRKRAGDESLKQLIREGVDSTSAVCVLVGAETAIRRWVRYEIARAVIDERGLLAVHINGLNHHLTKTPHVRGANPLACMGVGKVQPNVLYLPQYYLFELTTQGWVRYNDYTNPVKLPPYLKDPQPGWITWLSAGAGEYDYATRDGHAKIGSWIDAAAQQVGR